jgi:hypothetical protein
MFATAAFAENFQQGHRATSRRQPHLDQLSLRKSQRLVPSCIDRLASAADPLRKLKDIDASNLPATGKLTRLIDALVAAAFSEKGWAARLLARELLAPSSHARDEEAFESAADRRGDMDVVALDPALVARLRVAREQPATRSAAISKAGARRDI